MQRTGVLLLLLLLLLLLRSFILTRILGPEMSYSTRYLALATDRCSTSSAAAALAAVLHFDTDPWPRSVSFDSVPSPCNGLVSYFFCCCCCCFCCGPLCFHRRGPEVSSSTYCLALATDLCPTAPAAAAASVAAAASLLSFSWPRSVQLSSVCVKTLGSVCLNIVRWFRNPHDSHDVGLYIRLRHCLSSTRAE